MPSRKQGALGAATILGVIVVIRMLSGGREPPRPVLADRVEALPASGVVSSIPPRDPSIPREAFSAVDFEGLLAEGSAAVGQTIRTELYCGSIMQVSVRSTDSMNASLAQLADSDGRVAGAECRWGRDSQSSEFLLVIPPALAGDFARAPEVEINFVTRRRVPAELEWLGRSPELALRNAGILQLIII